MKNAEDEGSKQMADQRPRGTAKSREKDSAFDHVGCDQDPEAETARGRNRGTRSDEEAAEEKEPDDQQYSLGNRHQGRFSGHSIRWQSSLVSHPAADRTSPPREGASRRTFTSEDSTICTVVRGKNQAAYQGKFTGGRSLQHRIAAQMGYTRSCRRVLLLHGGDSEFSTLKCRLWGSQVG